MEARCPLCKWYADSSVLTNLIYEVECPACGHFFITDKAARIYQGHGTDLLYKPVPDAYRACAYIRRLHLSGDEPITIVTSLVTDAPNKRNKEQLDVAYPEWDDCLNLAVLNLYMLSEKGSRHVSLEVKDFPTLYCSEDKMTDVLRELVDEGFISGYYGGIPCSISLTKKARQYAKETVVVEKKGVIQLLNANVLREQFLQALFDATNGGDVYTSANAFELGATISLGRSDVNRIMNFLKDEGYLRLMGFGGEISITHQGIKALEQKNLTSPISPAVPVGVTNITVTNSPNAQVGYQSTQSYVHNQNQLAMPVDELLAFTAKLRAELPNLPISEDEKEDAAADLGALVRQLKAEKPDPEKVKSRFRSIAESVGAKVFTDFVSTHAGKAVDWVQNLFSSEA